MDATCARMTLFDLKIHMGESNMLKNSTILITGGTGSFGHTFVPMTLAKYSP